MRIIELLNSIALPITNEESDILRMFDSKSEIRKSDLDPRQQLLANGLVNKEVLSRTRNNDRIVYRKKIKT